ncbi:uncharacterized protein LOC130748328 isoform X2 [Lotus japonicus]|uniref:uncharacterized protein LOC130748328 isoform X2 n=1 Tax=Lotus japonicus TaxID=34305 RepID=UPI002587A68E|nr:uncharacterized protein LOC130748328 isoform X2 [Lotus japonicus]
MCDHDDWVNLAMADDSTVAGLLLNLHHRPHPHLHWTVRQRRSTHKTSPATTRASPTTPLSWSGAATSVSCGANNVDSHEEESSHLTKHAGASRSDKVANPSETVTTKKARRKKELASLRITVDQQIATNESLKKMKLDLDLRQNSNTTTTSEVSGKVIYGRPSQFMEAECRPSNSVYPKIVTHEVLDHDSLVYAANASSKAQEIGNQESTFILPDLNLPVEEDFSINAMH